MSCTLDIASVGIASPEKELPSNHPVGPRKFEQHLFLTKPSFPIVILVHERRRDIITGEEVKNFCFAFVKFLRRPSDFLLTSALLTSARIRYNQNFSSTAPNAPLAQLDRASDYESEGREFESLRARHNSPTA